MFLFIQYTILKTLFNANTEYDKDQEENYTPTTIATEKSNQKVMLRSHLNQSQWLHIKQQFKKKHNEDKTHRHELQNNLYTGANP